MCLYKWKEIRGIILEKSKMNKKKRKMSLRQIFRRIMSLLNKKHGWRSLGKRWELCYYYFRKWTNEGVFKDIFKLYKSDNKIRVIDSKTIVCTNKMSKSKKGINGHKKINGIKLQILTDINYSPMKITINQANMNDSKGGHLLLKDYKEKDFLLLANKGYRGSNISKNVRLKNGDIIIAEGVWCKFRCGIERTIANIFCCLRLEKCREGSYDSFESFIILRCLQLFSHHSQTF